MTTSDDPPPPTEIPTGLPRVFTPARAAEVLSAAGLDDLTECALRTRAYRRQIPFHFNGRRIIFTADDLREIAEGTAYRPKADEYYEQTASSEHAAPAPRPVPARRKAPPANDSKDRWRARRPKGG